MFDYIVVGAGSAGCVLAARLSENPEIKVLLLEAGGDDRDPKVRNPVCWPELFYTELDWNYQTAPLRSCNNRVDHAPRAKMLGGCHSHNASAWVRCHPNDFDSWAYQGCAGWGWADVQRLYKKIENWQGAANDARGTGGPMYIAPPEDPNPLSQAFVESGAAVGIPTLDDFNAGNMEGTTFFDFTIKNGERFSVVQAYLEPAMNRENLTVITHAVTHRLVMDGSRCVGVEYERDGELSTANAQNEVILSSGVFGSPAILMRSGIGPEQELNRLGVEAISNLQGVGQNLQDHALLAGIVYECKGALPEPKNNGAEATMWWRSRSGLTGPDIQPVMIEFPLATPDLLDKLPHENCYTISPSVVRVASRGTVTLKSTDPSEAPIIDVNYMSRDADIEAMLVAIDLCREMGASEAFSEFRKSEVMPGDVGKADMTEFIRQSASTYFHPTSTCKMGIGDDAVVDPELRVYGIEGLRIADASIMPNVTSGNTNAPSIMIGEKAAEMILGQE